MKFVKGMILGCALSIMFLAGCNSYNVKAMKFDPTMKAVTVVENTSVIVHDFVPVLENEFAARGISVRIVDAGHVAQTNEYVITYDARQSWDFVTYLTDANVRVRKNDYLVGSGRYHHAGGSCSLSLWKWQGTETKLKPLYDELLKEWSSNAESAR